MTENPKKRLWELDFLRGIAIILMVIFHVVYDLNLFFDDYTISHYQTGWFYMGRTAAFLFIGLVGIASAIIAQRYDTEYAVKKNIYRGLRLIALGMIITVATYMYDPVQTVWFGILHFLGVCILLSVFFMKLKWLNIPFALIMIVLGIWFNTLSSAHYYLLPLGITPDIFQSLDYYPLFPWFAIVLVGIFLGNLIYKNGNAVIKRTPLKVEKPIIYIGKYSLWIYMLHQPVLLGLIWVFL